MKNQEKSTNNLDDLNNADDLTVFFVKPHIIKKSEEIFQYLRENIRDPNDFNLMLRKRFLHTPKEFWREFYAHLKENYPEELEKMAEQFAAYGTGIDFALIKGKQIVKRVRTITGPTRYEENPDWTIRGHWGPYKLPNTIVHASAPREVSSDIKTIKKYFRLHISL